MLRLIQQAIDDMLWPAVFLMFFWLSFFADQAYDYNLNSYGLQPHNITGLRGIIFMPFLHGSFTHLFSNTIPFLVSGAFIFHFFKQKSWLILAAIWIFSGLGIWIFGDPNSMHIGASGVDYGMVAFLLTSGIIRKNRALSGVALVLIFLYGSMVWGLMPQKIYDGEKISWEGHLFGALVGILMALVYRKSGPEDDIDEIPEDEVMPQWWIDMQQQDQPPVQEGNTDFNVKDEPDQKPNSTIRINYQFKKNDDQ
ncbi:MAG: rhomboid family intramembrane serine protease [Bacteroidetes bacterium]|nr:rhomboid family intramembrane serine protease [Bacteroidota bacterium]